MDKAAGLDRAELDKVAELFARQGGIARVAAVRRALASVSVAA